MNKIKNFFYQIRNKIAFYPTLISLAGVFLAFFMIYLEEKNISAYFMKVAPGLVINNTDTAKTLLSTLIGGMISLTVFSFSMVMILLNQASSNFSPRVLPGIISDQKHQMVLGQYIATILYLIFILVSIEPTGKAYQTPGFSVLVGIVLTVLCLGSFIYFIHHISQAIQVGSILTDIHDKTKRSILSMINEQEQVSKEFPEQEHWESYTIVKSGYFYGLLKDDLVKICENENIKINVTLFKGQFILDDTIGFLANTPISKKTRDHIVETFLFSKEELIGENYIYGFRQITEIGIKAMSPGINDPGTALNTIDYLTSLFQILLKKPSHEFLANKQGDNLIKVKTIKFSEVLFNVLATYRLYCKHDITVMRKLIQMLRTLSLHVVSSQQMTVIQEEIDELFKDGKANIENPRDFDKIDSDYISWS